MGPGGLGGDNQYPNLLEVLVPVPLTASSPAFRIPDPYYFISFTIISGIVESNQKKFKITEAELNERKDFVEKTRSSLKEMRDHISSPRAQAFTERKSREALGISHPLTSDRFSRLDDEIASGNSRYIEEQQAQQQLIMNEQDANLELVSGSIRVLKNMSGKIGDELDEQAVMLDEFAYEMDNTQSRMDTVLKRMAKVSHMTSDRRQWCAIGILVLVLFIVLILLLTLP
ncbi:hypothetical protein GDO78_018297 [Eleutherodactylus coqui]|uniref:t-SNARE coiled-coil homology domain-containing protein n=1 Tax=Eleutherodactylus coqui TaxID=57060 RepID=A0A8J6EP64_ELECQ|nr:hypothetical protein GDO78_018297 [Eleutherodactylus coqui]KAG9472634.1 hypothetical protein GDO78_018297 [Eleutherodactylus coqui]